MVICLEQGAGLHMAQRISLPLTVSCFSKIQIGFNFLVPAHPGSPGQRAVKRVCVCVFRPKPPKNMVSAWFWLRQKGTVELRFRPKLDHVETETNRNWISSKQTVVGNDLPTNNYLVRQDKSTRTDEAI